MKIKLSLSAKTDKSGRAEVMIRLFNGSQINQRAKSDIKINPDFFGFYIDRNKTEELGIKVDSKVVTATRKEADKRGYILRDSGEIVIKQRIDTPEVLYHKEQKKRSEGLCDAITDTYDTTHIDDVKSDKNWLRTLVDKFNHPERYQSKSTSKKTFFELLQDYLDKKQFSYDHTKALKVLGRDVARYEGYIKETEPQRKDFSFDVDNVTREDIEDFMDYLRNEYTLAKENPELFKKLLEINPLRTTRKGHQSLEVRGDHTIIKLEKKLKAFFAWLYETGKTTNRPFDGIKIGSEEVGTPYYISIDERNLIACHDFSHSKHLETQRDIFIFQCFTGCRVGDLVTLTPDNIINGILVYDPHKTKGQGTQARVPLHEKALALIEKYKGVDKSGRLFPFISSQKYNDAIKVIFTQAGVTRSVVIRNPKTGESETRPINEIASSHLARRTFIGNAYFKVADPSIICKMSGHTTHSRAFARYRNIEDETLQDVINQIG